VTSPGGPHETSTDALSSDRSDVTPNGALHPGALGQQFEGRLVRLRPVFPDDMPTIYRLSTRGDVGFRWRYRANVISIEQFTHEFWQSVLVQLVVERRSAPGPVGLVVGFGPDLKNGTVSFGTLLQPSSVVRGSGAEASGMFIDYLFRAWPLRKVYAHVPAWNVNQFGSAIGPIFTEEGRLREHEYYDGKYWDVHIYSVTRSRWDAIRRGEVGWRARLKQG
jgi:RimJ/RimL family protein N-acetyltransferase